VKQGKKGQADFHDAHVRGYQSVLAPVKMTRYGRLCLRGAHAHFGSTGRPADRNSVAFGADILLPGPVPVPLPAVPLLYNWSGIYIGGNGGWGWASASGKASISGGFLNGSAATSGSGNGGIARRSDLR
jgi:hypothetical protein